MASMDRASIRPDLVVWNSDRSALDNLSGWRGTWRNQEDNLPGLDQGIGGLSLRE